ncbi:MAG: hypothetical protein K8T25_20605 [Planctomycetia bacterium]|nr:hypothetical protein [Planctomycetia bacterium]
MSITKFILAKYAPDPSRMEPRNIGVFLSHGNKVIARFLESHDAPFVNDVDTYSEWVKFWKEQIASESLQKNDGTSARKGDDAFLEALIDTQEGNYILVDGGFITENISKKDLRQARDFLFRELVAPKGWYQQADSKARAHKTLSQVSHKLFLESGISDRQDFRKSFPVECKILGVQKHIKFSYGIGNGRPNAIYQIVNIANDASVHSAALTMSSAIRSNIVKKNKCAALVLSESNEIHTENLALLENQCELIDMRNFDEAKDKASRIAA